MEEEFRGLILTAGEFRDFWRCVSLGLTLGLEKQRERRRNETKRTLPACHCLPRKLKENTYAINSVHLHARRRLTII